MNENTEKILYLGIGLLLCALALTAFFSSYGDYQAYIHQGERFLIEDKNINIYKEGAFSGITVDEVLHQVIEKRRQEEASRLNSIYNNISVPIIINTPEIWVEGMNTTAIDLNIFNIDQSFSIDYDIDPFGNIVQVRYIRK